MVALSQSTYSPSIQILRVASIGMVSDLLRARLTGYRDGDLFPDLLRRVSRSARQDRHDGLLERGRGLALAEVIEHQAGREHRGDGIRHPFAGNVGSRAVYRLEQRRAGSTVNHARVEVRARRRADAAGDGRAEVGQDVAEEVVGNDHVEAPRVVDQVQACGVDVAVVELHATLPRDLPGHAPPQVAGVDE